MKRNRWGARRWLVYAVRWLVHVVRGTAREVMRMWVAMLIVVACVCAGGVAGMPAMADGETALPADAINLADADGGISVAPTVAVSTATDAYTSTGAPIYNNYVTIQPENGAYDLNPQRYDNEHGAAKYRFKGDFTIPMGTLNDRDTLYFDLPAGVDYQELSEPIKDGDQNVGTYTVSTVVNDDGVKIGRVTLTLNEDEVKKNTTAELKGDFAYVLSAGEQANRDGLVWQIPGSKVPVTFGKAYDVHVEKSMTWRDEMTVSRPFTIKVTSRYGTPDVVMLADKLKDSDVAVEYTDIVVKKNGYVSDIACADLHGCALPKMDAGDSYEITYTATFPESEKDKEFTNVATVKTPDGNGGTLTHSSECNFRTPNPGGQGDDPDPKPWIYKQAVDTYVEEGEDGAARRTMIHWMVTLNENHANLHGWNLKDVPGNGVGKPENMQLCVRGTNECKAIDTLPYADFAEDDTNVYEFTYSTAYDAATWDDFRKDYANTASINKDGQGSQSTGTYSVPNPIAKVGGSISGRQDVESADGASRKTGRVLTWAARINVDNAVDIPSGWTFADELQQVSNWPTTAAHYFTTAQQQEIRDAVTAAFDEAGLATPTITFLAEDGGDGMPKTQFRITSANPLPAAKQIAFSYASTTDNPLNGVNDPFDFHNRATLGKFGVEAGVHYNPSDLNTQFTKTDTSGALSSDPNGNQGHASASLPTENWRPYLAWDINIRPGNELFKQMRESLESKDPQPLVITETLPQGLELMPAALDPKNKDANGNLQEETTPEQCWQDANSANGTDRHCAAGLEIKDTNGPSDTWEAGGIRFVRGDDADGKKTYRLYGKGALFSTVLATAAVDETWQDDDGDGTWEFDHQTVTIAIEPAMLKVIMPTMDGDNPNVDRWNRQGFTLVLRAGFHGWNPPLTMHELTRSYDNTATWSYAGAPGGSADSTVSVYDAQGNISKEFIGKNQGGHGVLPYQLNMNPKGECLAGASETDAAACALAHVSFDDVISYPHIVGYGKAALTLDRDSVAVYEVVQREADGSLPPGAQEFTPTEVSCDWQGCGPYDGAPVAVRKLGADEYSFKVESDHPQTNQGYCYKNECRHDGATWKEKLTFDVPNGKHLYIDYAYRMTGDYTDQAWLQVDNTATFAGTVARPSNTGSSVHMEEGNANISGAHFSMNKWSAERDEQGGLQLTNTHLGGAKFQLYRWDAQAGKFVPQGEPMTTPSEERSDDNGQVTQHIGEIVFGGSSNVPTASTEVQFDVAYMLREIEAPEGYEKAPDTYFVFRSGKTRFNETTGREEPVAIMAPEGFGVSGDYRNVKDMSVNDGTAAMLDIGDPAVEPQVELPVTGGDGAARWVAVVGAALLCVAMTGVAAALRGRNAIVCD